MEIRALIEVGAVFNWHIGKKFLPHGQMENTSIIVFRRMPVWRNFLNVANEKAKDIASRIG